ncbi:hypothetical protein HK101_008479 [Irineochytrium annulatum]|nr:hypothetical protein HK101_008479 [Irineochytrium annulatum]
MAPKINKLLWGSLGGITLVLCLLVITIGVLSYKEGKLQASQYEALDPYKTAYKPTTVQSVLQANSSVSGQFQSIDEALPARYCQMNSFIMVIGSVSSMDTNGASFKMRFQFTPCGDFIGAQIGVTSNFLLSSAVVLGIDTAQQIKFAAGQPMQTQEVPLNFGSGDVNNYPFEKYRSNDIHLAGIFFNATSNATEPLPIFLALNGALLTYDIDFPVGVLDDSDVPNTGTVVTFSLVVGRSSTTQIFSVGIMVIQWILSLLSFTLVVTLWLRGRKVEPPTLGFTISLLFALPAVRNVQPGAPPIGCTPPPIAARTTLGQPEVELTGRTIAALKNNRIATMAEVIRLLDSAGTRVLDSVSAEYEDSFSLEAFGDLVRSHADMEPRTAAIIARVQTWDPKQPEKAYYSYYNAFHLNKILFQTQVYLGKKLIHRLHVLNPLTNTDIIGSVQYFMVKYDDEEADIVPAEPEHRVLVDAPEKAPTFLSPTMTVDTSGSRRASTMSSRKRSVNFTPRKLSGATSLTTPSATSASNLKPSPAVCDAETGPAAWTRGSAAVVDITSHEDSDLLVSGGAVTPTSFGASLSLFVRRLSASPRSTIPDKQFRVSSTLESPSITTSTPKSLDLSSPKSLDVPSTPASVGLPAHDIRQRASSFDAPRPAPIDIRPTRLLIPSPTSPPTPATQARRHTSFTAADVRHLSKPPTSPLRLASPSSPAAKAPAPAGIITRFAVPLRPEDAALLPVPPTSRGRRRSLSYANAMAAVGTPGATFEDWAEMVRVEKRMSPTSDTSGASTGGAGGDGAAEGEVGDYDVVQPFLGAKLASPVEEGGEDGTEERGESGAGIEGELKTVDAVLFATDDDFLELSRIRSVFRQHALQPEDVALFEMKPFLGDDVNDLPEIVVQDLSVGREVARRRRCGFCYPSVDSMMRMSPGMRLFHRIKCYLAALVLVLAMFLL